MHFQVTLLYGGLCTLLVTALGLNVSRARGMLGVSLETPVPSGMMRAARAHANAAEWVPLGVLMLALLESSGVSSTALHTLGGTLLAARVLHAVGALGLAPKVLHTAGASLTYLVMVAMPAWAVWQHFAA
jgi:uncharacterized protein